MRSKRLRRLWRRAQPQARQSKTAPTPHSAKPWSNSHAKLQGTAGASASIHTASASKPAAPASKPRVPQGLSLPVP